MGFWSAHPMAGDLALDAKDELDCLLFTEEEIDNDLYLDCEIYKSRLLGNLEEAIHLEYPYGQRFVLPFTIAELQLRITDKKTSYLIKDMIGDGGNQLRGYPPIQAVGKDYKVTYNNFQTPLDYANQLRDLWDDLMEGKVPFTVLKDQGNLFDYIVQNFI